MQHTLRQGLAGAYPKWKCVDEEAHVDSWFQQCDCRAVIGVRFPGASTRQRTWKVAYMPCSWRARVVSATAFIGRSYADDIVLNLVLSRHTLLIERAWLARHRLSIESEKL